MQVHKLMTFAVAAGCGWLELPLMLSCAGRRPTTNA
jgi:hypothetical protein